MALCTNRIYEKKNQHLLIEEFSTSSFCFRNCFYSGRDIGGNTIVLANKTYDRVDFGICIICWNQTQTLKQSRCIQKQGGGEFWSTVRNDYFFPPLKYLKQFQLCNPWLCLPMFNCPGLYYIYKMKSIHGLKEAWSRHLSSKITEITLLQ